MTEKTRVKIENMKAVVGGKWFTSKDCKENGIDVRTILKNLPETEIETEKEYIICDISETEYKEAIEKYGDRMDGKYFGGIGFYYEENGKFYNKRCAVRYRFK